MASKISVSDNMMAQGWPGGTAASGPTTPCYSKHFIGNGFFFINRKFLSNDNEFRNEKRVKKYFPSVKVMKLLKDKDFTVWARRAKVPAEFTLWMLNSATYGDLVMFQSIDPDALGAGKRLHTFISREWHRLFGQFLPCGAHHKVWISRRNNGSLIVRNDTGDVVLGLTGRTNLYELNPPTFSPEDERVLRKTRMKDVNGTQSVHRTKAEKRQAKRMAHRKPFKMKGK